MARQIIGNGGWLAAGLFAVALGVRLLNAPYVFEGSGKPRITPVDELYHWKRIAYSAAHFPHVLEFDRDRGIGGAFCPWPPLYDVASGGVARLLGAGTGTDKRVCATFSPSGKSRDQNCTDTLVCADGVLERIVWFPPILFALFVAITVFILSRMSMLVAAITGIALATSPFLVTTSWIGSIDHHFLEPVLTFAILGAACLGMRADTRRRRVRASILLGIAITAAMFVQTALLISAALAFAVLFLWSDGVAATCGFGIAAVAVAIYRLTRAPGFPDNQWFLGWTHASLFAAAAAACAIVGIRSPWRVNALLPGVAVVLAPPTVPASLLSGAPFFGGA